MELLRNERKTPFFTSANTKTGSRKYRNGQENVENGTGQYGKNSVRFHPYPSGREHGGPGHVAEGSGRGSTGPAR
jgi:hypothetical protein